MGVSRGGGEGARGLGHPHPNPLPEGEGICFPSWIPGFVGVMVGVEWWCGDVGRWGLSGVDSCESRNPGAGSEGNPLPLDGGLTGVEGWDFDRPKRPRRTPTAHSPRSCRMSGRQGLAPPQTGRRGNCRPRPRPCRRRIHGTARSPLYPQ